ncbi:MAG TPA: DegT/DnrJ/EryC1/StrS family aminotransferase [Gammaproteobacteria bacterium]|nr:DegT/DnrJ/EryC1/StrS family aminotransferase [Gammaproteobacteria bacterium]
MQFIDLKSQQARIRDSIDRRLAALLDHGQYILGPEVTEMEQSLAAYVGVAHCVSAASGTDALLLALMALDIGPGDEVITSPFSFIATAEVIALVGATPVFVDVDPVSYNLDPGRLEAAIGDRTRAIMPVSLFGLCADMDAINAIAARHRVPVIEDAAQSFGATYHDRRSCGLSLIGCTSFFPAKPLGCYGDGGACFTNDTDIALRLKELRNHGQDRQYHHPRIGINGRMDGMQAAVILAKMEIFDDEVAARARIGARYSELLQDSACVTPAIADGYTSVYAQYTLQVDNRDAVRKALQDAGIPSAVYYPITLDQQPALAGRSRISGDLGVAHALQEKVMSLPMHPYLDDATQDQVAAALRTGL